MKKYAGTRLMVVEVWYLSFNVLQIVGGANVPQTELSFWIPTLQEPSWQPGAFSFESYQSFDFVNFMLDGRPCFLQTDIKTPLWAFCILPVSSSISGKCGPHIYGGGRESKEWKCSELLLEHWWHQKRLKCELVVSEQMATSGQQPHTHNNPAGFRITCAWSDPLELSAWAKPRKILLFSLMSGEVTLTAIFSTVCYVQIFFHLFY